VIALPNNLPPLTPENFPEILLKLAQVAEKSELPGPIKKKAVMDAIINLLNSVEAEKEALQGLVRAAPQQIDQIVSLANDTIALGKAISGSCCCG